VNNALLSLYDYRVLIASCAVCIFSVDFVVHAAEEKLECIWKSSLLLFEVRLEEGWVIFALMFFEQISCKMTAILLICFIIPRLNIVDRFATSSKSQENYACSSKLKNSVCLFPIPARKYMLEINNA